MSDLEKINNYIKENYEDLKREDSTIFLELFGEGMTVGDILISTKEYNAYEEDDDPEDYENLIYFVRDGGYFSALYSDFEINILIDGKEFKKINKKELNFCPNYISYYDKHSNIQGKKSNYCTFSASNRKAEMQVELPYDENGIDFSSLFFETGDQYGEDEGNLLYIYYISKEDQSKILSYLDEKDIEFLSYSDEYEVKIQDLISNLQNFQEESKKAINKELNKNILVDEDEIFEAFINEPDNRGFFCTFVGRTGASFDRDYLL